MITFATQNIIMDPPLPRWISSFARNLLIYLTPELQKKLLPLFPLQPQPGRRPVSRSAESVGTFTDLFVPLNIRSRLFRRFESVLPAGPRALPGSTVPALPDIPKELTMLKQAANLQSLADQLLLQHFSPPAVLVKR